MQYSMKTDKGVVRPSNQDNCCFTAFDDTSCFAVVCDGMGGPNAGDVASAVAVKEISDAFLEGWNKTLSQEEVKKLLSKAIKTANLKIYALAASNAEYKGMGTTVVAALVVGNTALVANVGDSRAYIVNEKLVPVTKDHSLVQELLDTGKLTPLEADYYPYKNVITRAVGIDNHIDVDFFGIDLSEAALLLCSDGLYNFVSEDEIVSLITSDDNEINEAASRLVDAANSNGGGDNITAIVIKQ